MALDVRSTPDSSSLLVEHAGKDVTALANAQLRALKNLTRPRIDIDLRIGSDARGYILEVTKLRPDDVMPVDSILHGFKHEAHAKIGPWAGGGR